MPRSEPPEADEIGDDSLINIRHALQFLYEEAMRNENSDLALILRDILNCCDDLIKGGSLITQNDAWYSLQFLKRSLALQPRKLACLVRLLSSLESGD